MLLVRSSCNGGGGPFHTADVLRYGSDETRLGLIADVRTVFPSSCRFTLKVKAESTIEEEDGSDGCVGSELHRVSAPFWSFLFPSSSSPTVC